MKCKNKYDDVGDDDGNGDSDSDQSISISQPNPAFVYLMPKIYYTSLTAP